VSEACRPSRHGDGRDQTFETGVAGRLAALGRRIIEHCAALFVQGTRQHNVAMSETAQGKWGMGD
jgi:hypothetical protein